VRRYLVPNQFRLIDRQFLYLAPLSTAGIQRSGNMKVNVIDGLIRSDAIILPHGDTGPLIRDIYCPSRLANAYHQCTRLCVIQI